MTWRLEKRLEERAAAKYSVAERKAFTCAYSDGYYGHPRGASGSDMNNWPNAYGAGYNEGQGDRNADRS